MFQRPDSSGLGRRRLRKMDSQGQPIPEAEEETDRITRMGRIYYKILNFSIVTRYFIYVLPLALAIAIPIIVGATAAKKAKLGGVRIVWFFTWIEIVWLSVWVAKIVAHFLPIVFQALAGVVSSGTRKYALILKKLEIPISLVGWAVTSLATFIPLMTRNPDGREKGAEVKPWMSIVQKILAAALVSAIILLLERVIIQLISINYHKRQFEQRVKGSKRNVYLLSILYDASRTLFPAYCNEFADEDYTISDTVGMLAGPKAHGRRQGRATPMRLVRDVGRVGDKLTSAFGNIASEITGKQVFNPNSAHSIVVLALEKKTSSEALARRLWMSFVVEGRNALFEEDIVEVLGPTRTEEAAECFNAIDQDGNGDISLEEMIMTVTQFGRERKSIASSMHDVDQAINVLDGLLCAVVFVICIFIFVAFLNASFTTTLATAGTALLSMSFVFATTCQEVLGSCIFLFVKHPYDIGDRVDISKEFLIVERISLLYTEFKSVTTSKCVQIPNIVLNSLWVENITRSKAMREPISISVSFDTSFEDLALLKSELTAFVTHKDNCRDFQPDLDVELLSVGDMSKLELRVDMRTKSNWSNETLRTARRSKFMSALVLALRKVPIYGPGGGGLSLGDAGNPSYSVAITPDTAEQNKKTAADTMDAKRMVPANPKPDDSTSPGSNTAFASSPGSNDPPPQGHSTGIAPHAELSAMNTLTSRPVGYDRARDDAFRQRRSEDNISALSGPGLGERPSYDVREMDEVRGLLREQSGGKRKAGGGPASTPYSESSAPPATYPATGQSSTQGAGYPPQVSLNQSTGYGQGLSMTPSTEHSVYPVPYQPPSGASYQQYGAQPSMPPPQGPPPVSPVSPPTPTRNAFAQQHMQQGGYAQGQGQQQQQQQQGRIPRRGVDREE
ncbi:hypothetical protein P152DRAFT_396145 [Eremomyces bilateralis CBS 781.70]|uniref:EF-hand domain-containing protein n=1 Tax=Eremomyces bilateralis CBS 781.70 TaxID=1392243 RepID=A0A6G1G427_9PEZI|nr:uncharacterized protein P152DRAFT_396145 [Eremomyces bilateralis CBS 781.70]KAF1812813.1 hypothetical protein P152DRAFT_396145 [Eremomyces bilateralis CBS 781.70]